MAPASCAFDAFAALATAAGLGSAVHAWKLVLAATTTVVDPLAAMSPKLQLRFNPLVVHPVVVVIQVRPPPEGSVSLSVTVLAVPVPVLLTTMVKVAVSPALIV
jgi:hypothetical protein